jgi:hypothetical protein
LILQFILVDNEDLNNGHCLIFSKTPSICPKTRPLSPDIMTPAKPNWLWQSQNDFVGDKLSSSLACPGVKRTIVICEAKSLWGRQNDFVKDILPSPKTFCLRRRHFDFDKKMPMS